MAQDIKMILQKDDATLGKKGGVIEVTSAEQVAYFEKAGIAKVATDAQETKAEKAEEKSAEDVKDALKVIDKKAQESEADKKDQSQAKVIKTPAVKA